MVAAGGGSGSGNNNVNMGYGGALVGGNGKIATGATQLFPGNVDNTAYKASEFGIANGGCAGGGGYYGGGGATCVQGAGGGSSYISGHKGCVAYNVANDPNSYFEYVEKDKYMGTLDVDLVDERNEILTNDFYLRIYSGGQLVENKQVEFTTEAVQNYIVNYEFVKNKNYIVKSRVKSPVLCKKA